MNLGKMTLYISRQYGNHNISKYTENNETINYVFDMEVMKPLTPKVTVTLHPYWLLQNIFLKRVWGQLGNQNLCIDPGNDQNIRYRDIY